MVRFLAGATAMAIQIESLLGRYRRRSGPPRLPRARDEPTGFSSVRYHIAVAGDGTREQFEALRTLALAHSPNANALARGLALEGDVSVR
jgi:hypothetical protein